MHCVITHNNTVSIEGISWKGHPSRDSGPLEQECQSQASPRTTYNIENATNSTWGKVAVYVSPICVWTFVQQARWDPFLNSCHKDRIKSILSTNTRQFIEFSWLTNFLNFFFSQEFGVSLHVYLLPWVRWEENERSNSELRS